MKTSTDLFPWFDFFVLFYYRLNIYHLKHYKNKSQVFIILLMFLPLLTGLCQWHFSTTISWSSPSCCVVVSCFPMVVS